jgi:hypothetical protein
LPDDSTDPSSPLERREFLKLGAAGLAASAAGCTPRSEPVAMPGPAVEGSPPAGPPPGGPGSGTGGGQGPGGGGPPDLATLVDPPELGIETWQEPWVWRATDWDDARLDLNLVRYQSPAPSSSPGNPTPALFSYNGVNPAPTIRVRGDGIFRLRIRNQLGPNLQETRIGPAPDPVDLVTDTDREVCALVEAARGGDPENPQCNPFFWPEQLHQVVDTERRPGWSIKGHVNGQNCTHTTNIHTHGLHVSPTTNPDGTHSDNVLLRILPRGDWERRRASENEDLHTLEAHEHVGELEYELRLGYERDGAVRPHPPGTHWYHPHSHGATHDQVASGMAGFIIVEGDVDEAINRAMTGESWPEPDVATGPHGYRERLMLIQRVFVGSVDLDAGRQRNNVRFPPLVAVNGAMPSNMTVMRPGAVERWRVLNGSVDGSGTKRFMVLEGQFAERGGRMWRVVAEGEGETRTRRLEPVTPRELEEAKVGLYQLSFDGFTLIEETDGAVRHTIRDLSLQNAGTENPFTRPAEPGEGAAEARLRGLEDCFRDGESLRNAFVRPNEVFLGNANRADVFFKAPLDAAGKTFTIFAQEAHIHTDNLQVQLQLARARVPGALSFFKPDFDVVVGYIYVDGDPVEGGDFDVLDLRDVLPPVPDLLMPVREDELRVGADEAARSGVPAGEARTRVLSYSGTGGATWPCILYPPELAEAHPELEDIVWGVEDGTHVLLPNLTRTMAIHPDFDLAANPDPGPPIKFSPGHGRHARVLVDTAEEWVLYNCSQTLWGRANTERYPQPGAWNLHRYSYVMSRAEGQRRNRETGDISIMSRASDHPFHIHVNPMWVLRVEVPDENGELHNVLPEPQWMDTVPIPRNGGRVVFRTRFDDFVGTWVHHCHILAHEDMGMMQLVECLDDAAEANYRGRETVASHAATSAQVSEIYPRPSEDLMYRQNLSFVDHNDLGRQNYPGFELEVPRLSDD